MENEGKVLVIHPEKCTGCRLCEMVCAVKHEGASNPARSRIRVIKWEMEGMYVPISCQQCQDAPCMSVCPAGAISRNEELDFVQIDQDRCIGCRTCVAVCPFGAMSYNTTDKKVFKCDLCDGDPQCVRFCEVECLEYMDAGDVSILKKQEAALKLTKANQKASQL
jgi:Fe-S-cluster-containing hydrogenase component 2